MYEVCEDNLCDDVLSTIWDFGLAISVWLELSLCVSTLLRSYRCGLGVNRWLPLISLLLAVSTVTIELVFMDPKRPFNSELFTSGIAMCITALTSCCCLVLVACRARRCGDAVEKRSLLCAAAFMANVAITELPMASAALVQSIAPSKFLLIFEDGWPGDVALLMLSLSGAANAYTFFWQSRYSAENIKDVANCKLDADRSFQVHLGGETTLDESA